MIVVMALPACGVSGLEERSRPVGKECGQVGNVCTWASLWGNTGGMRPIVGPATEVQALVRDISFRPDGTAIVEGGAYEIGADVGVVRRFDAGGGGLVNPTLPIPGHSTDFLLPLLASTSPVPGPSLGVVHPTTRTASVISAEWELEAQFPVGPECTMPAMTYSRVAAMLFDSDDGLYVANASYHVIVRIDADGVIRHVAGAPICVLGPSEPVEGDAAEVQLRFQEGSSGGMIEAGLVLDEPFLYATDLDGIVWQIDLDAGTAVIFAGDPDKEFSDDWRDGFDALSANLRKPGGLARGADGTFYVPLIDSACVRAIRPDGTVHTVLGVCGEPGYDGDGFAATEAHVDMPTDVDIGPDGNLYVTDAGASVVRVVHLEGGVPPRTPDSP